MEERDRSDKDNAADPKSSGCYTPSNFNFTSSYPKLPSLDETNIHLHPTAAANAKPPPTTTTRQPTDQTTPPSPTPTPCRQRGRRDNQPPRSVLITALIRLLAYAHRTKPPSRREVRVRPQRRRVPCGDACCYDNRCLHGIVGRRQCCELSRGLERGNSRTALLRDVCCI